MTGASSTGSEEVGAGEPTNEAQHYDRRSEVEAILASDDTLLGRVYRYDLAGRTPLEMAEEEGNAGPGFVYGYRTALRALLDEEIPTSTTLALAAARRVRRWLKSVDMSAELRADLQRLEQRLMSKADNVEAQLDEAEDAVKASEAAEAKGTPGIYVYTLPHYVRYPVDPETGKTFLKVGHSAKDVYYRAGAQGRLTALPEEPILLRIYAVNESAAAEKTFHAWLRDADHMAARTKRAGAEWFLTSTKFLDRIAQSLGLQVEVVNEFEAGDA
jgi:hypothetical protein